MTEADGWQRFHPLTPLLRGGVMLTAVAAWVISNQLDTWFGNESQIPAGAQVRWLALGVLAVLLLAVGAGWLSWRAARFRVGLTTVELRQGLLFRQHREVRYDRVQAVDIRRPLLARLAGLAEVKVQAAGSSDAGVRLGYLAWARAQEVRDELTARAGRSDEVGPVVGPVVGPMAGALPRAAPPAPGAPGMPGASGMLGTPAAPATVVVRVPNARLVQSALYSGQMVFLVLAVPTAVAAVLLDVPGLLAALGPMLLAVGGRHLGLLVKQLNFEVLRGPAGIVVRRGLTELRSSTLPAHRIQVVSVLQPAFWRLPDWWRVEVNVAGLAGGEDADTVVLPVGTRAEALALVRLLRPSTDQAALEDGLTGAGPAAGDAAYVTAPPQAVWLSPLVRRRHGYAVTPDALLVRGGWLRRFVQLVPHARIQSLTLRQGPVQRRLGLASLHLLSTPGPADPWVQHLAEPVATALLNDQVVRSSRARELVR